jgi:hypothetical protein
MKSKKSLFSKFASPIKINPLFTGILKIGKRGMTGASKNTKNVS